MSKERLEEINNFSSLPLKKRISLTKESIKKELKANDYHMPKNININTQYLLEIIEQAEQADYYKHQSKRKTQALEEIADLLTEDYFENWEQAIEIAHKHKKNTVRMENLENDLRIRKMEESE